MSTSAPQAANDVTWTSTGVVDAQGNPYWKGKTPPPQPPVQGSGGGDGPVTPLWRLDIRRDVQFAKWGTALLLAAFGTAFMYFIGEFKDVRKDLSAIQSSQAAQAATMQSIHDTLGKMDQKLQKLDVDTGASSMSQPTPANVPKAKSSAGAG